MRQLFSDLAEACPLCAGLIVALVAAFATVAAMFGVDIEWGAM